MKKLLDLEFITPDAGNGVVGYWSYNAIHDEFTFSSEFVDVFDLAIDGKCSLNGLKSLIIGADVVVFVNTFNNWLKGDTSRILNLRFVDSEENITTVQIKARMRKNNKCETVLYGAYIRVSNWLN